MPHVKLKRAMLVGTRILPPGRVIECDARKSEHYVRSGAADLVPHGTPDDEEEEADPLAIAPPPAPPRHESTESRRAPEHASARRGR